MSSSVPALLWFYISFISAHLKHWSLFPGDSCFTHLNQSALHYVCTDIIKLSHQCFVNSPRSSDALSVNISFYRWFRCRLSPDRPGLYLNHSWLITGAFMNELQWILNLNTTLFTQIILMQWHIKCRLQIGTQLFSAPVCFNWLLLTLPGHIG